MAATGGTTQDEARPVFERAFREHGLPKAIRSGNGTPFASTGTAGLTALPAWRIKLGIRHARIDPGHPRQNGRHERFHRTLLEAMRPPSADRSAQARRFKAFATGDNEERPHAALGQQTPASVYHPSVRRCQEGSPSRLIQPRRRCAGCGRTARSSGRAIRSTFASRACGRGHRRG
ncbi:MAG: integrase core domain-containing protein [Beijerinckiaceae bacterium]